MLVHARRQHRADEADPQQQVAQDRVDPDPAGVDDVAQDDLHERQREHRSQEHRQERGLESVQRGDQAHSEAPAAIGTADDGGQDGECGAPHERVPPRG